MAVPPSEDQLLVLYQSFLEDIRYAKRQQWNSIYLTLLGIAGVLSLAFALQSKNIWGGCLCVLLIVLVGLLSALGGLFIGNYQRDIVKYRIGKEAVLKTLPSEDVTGYLESKEIKGLAHLASGKYIDRCKHWERFFKLEDGFIYPLLFWIVICLTSIAAIWVLWIFPLNSSH